MNKAIVIGATSFSGINFSSYLIKKNFQVIGVGRSNFPKKYFLPPNIDIKNEKFKFYKIDINKNLSNLIILINKFKPNFIINFSSQSMVAESWDKPYDWFLTNSYSIPYLYYELSKLKFKYRLVHVSTPEVYGNTIKKINENKNFNPNTPYAVSRTTADYYLNILQNNSDIDFVSTRSANVYGEYQDLFRIIPKTILCILKKEKLFLHGNGVSRRSFIHIDDVCSATYLLMVSKKLSKNRFYNISTERLLSIKELVVKICDLMDSDFESIVKNSLERTGKDFIYHLDSSKIKKLGWRPKICLDNGIFRTAEWIKSNIKNFKSIDLKYVHQS
jgi:dTDP-glucose 4,6-dehydratase